MGTNAAVTIGRTTEAMVEQDANLRTGIMLILESSNPDRAFLLDDPERMDALQFGIAKAVADDAREQQLAHLWNERMGPAVDRILDEATEWAMTMSEGLDFKSAEERFGFLFNRYAERFGLMEDGKAVIGPVNAVCLMRVARAVQEAEERAEEELTAWAEEFQRNEDRQAGRI